MRADGIVRAVVVVMTLLVAGCVSAAKSRATVVPAGATAVITLRGTDSVRVIADGPLELEFEGRRLALSRAVPQSFPIGDKPTMTLANPGDEPIGVRLLLEGGSGLEADVHVR